MHSLYVPHIPDNPRQMITNDERFPDGHGVIYGIGLPQPIRVRKHRIICYVFLEVRSSHRSQPRTLHLALWLSGVALQQVLENFGRAYPRVHKSRRFTTLYLSVLYLK